ncbi:MAG TPA: molybdate ABC transporter substrate-binding protein [Mycobacterium sp.]
MRRTCVLTGAAALLVTLTGGCSTGRGAPSVTVFAAASLKPVFTEIARRFEADNPGAAVDFNFGGSSDLATQLIEGAAADVFASANTAQMDKVADAGRLAGAPVPFAANTLVIVTAAGNPEHVAAFADLARPGLTVVLCQQPVPCGAAARRLEERTAVHIQPVSEEPDVTDVLTKVTSGQADAGLVYRTDAINAGDHVTAVEFPEAAQAVNTYPVALLNDAAAPALARKFVDLVTGVTGQQMLRAAGFAQPAAEPGSPGP